MVEPTGEQTAGIEFELLRTYPLSVAMTAAHPFARLKSVSLDKLAAEPLVGFRRKDYPEYNRILDRLFAPIRATPRIAVECDSASSLITEVEAGRGIALANTVFKLVTGKRLLYRPLMGTTEVLSVGIARATKGDVTPAGEKFCELLRKISNGTSAAKPKLARSWTTFVPTTSRIHRKCVAKHRFSTFGLLPCRFVLNDIPVLDQHAIFDTNDVRRNPVRGSAKA